MAVLQIERRGAAWNRILGRCGGREGIRGEGKSKSKRKERRDGAKYRRWVASWGEAHVTAEQASFSL